MLNIKIGPYTLFKRTEYSKIIVLDENGENINKDEEGRILSEKIISSYKNQAENKEKYFQIMGDELDGYIDNLNTPFIFIPDSIKRIDTYCFSSSLIEYIYIPDSVEYIEDAAFKDCKHLKEVNLPDSINEMGAEIFHGCNNLKRCTLPENIKYISRAMFCGCESLEKIVIPKNVRTIGDASFNWCRSLEKINIPCMLERSGSIPFRFSTITTFVFDNNLEDSKDPNKSYQNLFKSSSIYKIEINKNVSHIDPNILKYVQNPIKEIVYNGSSIDFQTFKENNEHFLSLMSDAKINFKENLENIITENTSRIGMKEAIVIER